LSPCPSDLSRAGIAGKPAGWGQEREAPVDLAKPRGPTSPARPIRSRTSLRWRRSTSQDGWGCFRPASIRIWTHGGLRCVRGPATRP